MNPLCRTCGQVFLPAQHAPERCRHCDWGDGSWPDEGDPRFLVLFAVVERAAAIGRATPPEKTSTGGWSYQPSRFMKVEASRRETCVLRHGDQIKVDGIIWRVTAVHGNLLWFRAFRLEKHHGLLKPVDPWFKLGGVPR